VRIIKNEKKKELKKKRKQLKIKLNPKKITFNKIQEEFSFLKTDKEKIDFIVKKLGFIK